MWEGQAGNAFRHSVDRFADRVHTVPEAARGVAAALETLAGDMENARKRHADAFDGLREHLSISWGDLWPWELADLLGGIVGEVVDAIEDLIGAYLDAGSATAAARRAITGAMDGIELPDHLPRSMPSVIDLVNSWSDDDGPLDGSVLARYDDALAAMTPEQREQVRRALAETSDPDARAWIMAAVAFGLGGAALLGYIDRIRQLSPPHRWTHSTRPASAGTRQATDQTTCGSSTLVMSRMENNPAYALWILTGYDAETGLTDPRTPDERFRAESYEMHERTNPSDRPRPRPAVPLAAADRDAAVGAGRRDVRGRRLRRGRHRLRRDLRRPRRPRRRLRRRRPRVGGRPHRADLRRRRHPARVTWRW